MIIRLNGLLLISEIRNEMVKLLILEALGIPRIRIGGISIFNVLGTILFAYPLTLCLRYLYFFEQIKYFQVVCLFLVCAPLVHYLMGDHTPLVKLIMEKKMWQILIVLMGLTGISGSYTLLFIMFSYSVLLLGQDHIELLFWKFLDKMM